MQHSTANRRSISLEEYERRARKEELVGSAIYSSGCAFSVLLGDVAQSLGDDALHSRGTSNTCHRRARLRASPRLGGHFTASSNLIAELQLQAAQIAL